MATLRKYSHGQLKDHVRYGFSGQGQSLILLTVNCKALFGWNQQLKRDDGQSGINCFVFRNEGAILSSMLILEAEQFAWQKWPNERLFTFINSDKIRSTNPGYCFLKAGWHRCGKSKKGLDYTREVSRGYIRNAKIKGKWRIKHDTETGQGTHRYG